jgi:hypothetical protein
VDYSMRVTPHIEADQARMSQLLFLSCLARALCKLSRWDTSENNLVRRYGRMLLRVLNRAWLQSPTSARSRFR